MDTIQGTTSVRFASFELDVRSRELRRGSTCIRLQEQPFEILRLMLERRGDVVTREELQQRLWPDGTFVDYEHSLNAAVKRLRAALGDDAENPTFVETLPRRGYRFIAPLADPDTEGRAAKVGPVSVGTGGIRLAVLPFSNLSDDSTQEYFSDGLTEELIAQLGPLCRGKISVIARRSSMVFKGTLQRACEVAEVLRANYLLEGSVRRDGRRVRITVRLVEGATEAELWSDTHDRTVDDWLGVQADVAAHMARSLMLELAPARTTAAPDPRAHHAYLKARFHWGRPADVGFADAMRWLDEALRIAPQFAPAWGLLGRVQIGAADYYRDVPRAALEAAREAAGRALALDPTNCEAQVVVGDVTRMVDFDWQVAARAYRQALADNPSSELAHRGQAFLLAIQGHVDEAVRAAELTRELDPLCLVPSLAVAWTRYVAGDYEGAATECRHGIDLGPEFAPSRRLLAAVQLQQGDADAAVATLQEARQQLGEDAQILAWLAHAHGAAGERAEAIQLISALRDSNRQYVSSYHLAAAYVGINSVDAAFEALAHAWVDRDPLIAHLRIEPRFAPLRGDERYRRLLERMNLGTKD